MLISSLTFVCILLSQRHLTEIPSGLPTEEAKLMKKRRAHTIRTMEAMSVLDIAKGLDEEENGDDGFGEDRSGGKKKKSKKGGGRDDDDMYGGKGGFEDF